MIIISSISFLGTDSHNTLSDKPPGEVIMKANVTISTYIVEPLYCSIVGAIGTD